MCDYCRIMFDVDGKSIIPSQPKPLINAEWNDLGIETIILVETLFTNLDVCDDEGNWAPWKTYTLPINYCPVCGRRLDSRTNREELELNKA